MDEHTEAEVAVERVGTGDSVSGVLSAERIRQMEEEFEAAFTARAGPGVQAASGLGVGGFGGVDEHSGAYAYSIPVAIPEPLNRGPEPKLALTYNSMSSRAPSLIAAGWRLEIDAIERVSNDPLDPMVDFHNDQTHPAARDSFALRVDGMSFKLVPHRNDPDRFYAKNESAYAEARRLLSSRLDPISQEPIIDGWLVTLGRGVVYVFGVLGDDGEVAGEVLNKRWLLTEIRGIHGQKALIDYESYANDENTDWQEAPFPYPIRVRCGAEPDGTRWDSEVEFVYHSNAADVPSKINGYGNLGIEYTGREIEAEGRPGLTCVLWRRLTAVRVRYRDESSQFQTRQEIRLQARRVGQRFVLDRIDEVYFKDGQEDPSASYPPHRFVYDFNQGEENPALMVQVTKPLGSRERLTYARADQVDPEANHVSQFMVVTSATLEAEGESWTTRYRYLGGLFYTPWGEYRGHREVEVIAEATGLTTLTRYQQNGVHNACRAEVIARDARSRDISRERFTWQALDYGGGRMLPFVQRSVREAYHDTTGAVIASEVKEIPLREPADLKQPYAIDDFGCPEIEILQFYAGPPEGTPLAERRIVRTYAHIVGPEVGQRFIGLERESRIYARLRGDRERLVEWTENVHDSLGQMIASTMHIDREDPRQVYTKFRDYHPRTGVVLREFRGDGAVKKLMTEIRYFEDGPYRSLPHEHLDAAGNSEGFLRYDLAHREPVEAIVGSGMLLRKSFDAAGRASEEIFAGHQDAIQAAAGPNSVRHRYIITETERAAESVGVFTGCFQRTEFDRLGRPIREIKSIDGGRRVAVDTRYDRMTREVAAVSEPYLVGTAPGAFSITEYDDPRRRVSREVSPSGLVTRHRYDGLTKIVEQEITAPDGTKRLHVVEETVDPRNLTIRKAEGASGGPTRYEVFFDYDEANRLIRIRDSLGAALERHDYGSRIDGKAVEIQDMSRGRTRLHYGPLGDIVEARQDFVTGLDRVCRMQHDGLGRVERQVDEDTATGARREFTMQYDARPHGLGLIARSEVVELSALGRYAKSERYAYDPCGLAERIEQTWDIDWPGLGVQKQVVLTAQYGHNGQKGGRLERLVHPTIDGLGGGVAEYRYDDASGLLTEISFNGRSIWRADAFTVRGQVARVRLGNGLTMDYDHDPATGRIERIVTQRGSEDVLAYDVAYDNGLIVVGRRAQGLQLDPAGRESTGSVDGRYRYDDKNQLIDAAESGLAQRFVYHPHGGRRRLEADQEVHDYAYDGASAHQVTRIDGPRPRALSYDRAGNLVRDSLQATGVTRQLAWNPSNMVRTLTLSDRDGTALRTLHYGYGATNERCFTVDVEARRLTLHVTDRMDLEWRLAEHRLIVHTHVHNGARWVATISEEAGAAPRIHYYHRDHTHSVGLLTDTDGRVVYSARFAPFGAVLEESGPRPDLLFAGHRAELVDEHGFHEYDFRARHYDPDLGGFLSPDPHLDEHNVGFGYNRYVYAGNSPVSFSDPTGFDTGHNVWIVHPDYWEELGPDWQKRTRQIAARHGFTVVLGDDKLFKEGPAAIKALGKNINHVILDGHGNQARKMLGSLGGVLETHNVKSVTSLGCKTFGKPRATLRDMAPKAKYFASAHLVQGAHIDGIPQLVHGKGDLHNVLDPKAVRLENIEKGYSPFVHEKVTVDHALDAIPVKGTQQASEVHTKMSADLGKTPGNKMISKVGGSLMKGLNVVGVISDMNELADNVKRGDVEGTGKKVGTMIAGRVPGGDLAFEFGYSIGETINHATDNFVPKTIANAAESIGLHKVIYNKGYHDLSLPCLQRQVT